MPPPRPEPPPPLPTPAPTLCCAFDDSREVQELDVGTFVLGSRRVRWSWRAGKGPAEPGSAPGPGLSLVPPQPAQRSPCPESGEASWEGPFPSEMTDAFPQLQASASAHWGQRKPCRFPGGDEREVSPGSPPPGPLSSGAEEVQRQGMGHGDRDTETHGDRQRYMDKEAGETKNQAGRLRKTTDRD